ncbi:MAG: hypothetical protein ACT4O9_04615 [Blastocatellia bacterium]
MIRKSKSITLAIICFMFAVFVQVESTTGQAILRNQNRYTKANVNGIISRLENSSNTFRRDFDRAMDRSSLNGTPAEDRFNGYVRDYENQLDRLRRDFDRNDAWWQVRNQVQDVIREANPVNTMMNTIAFRRNLERQWNAMRNDVNTLADTYDLPGLNGGGWDGGGGGGGGAGNVPNWAVGTFYARNPENAGTITMTVNRNGSVTLLYDGGSLTYATMNRTTLRNGPYTSRVSRLSNGIRTTDNRSGQSINYYTSPNWDGGGGGGGGGNVPSWALGTFFARNPESSGTITMTIERNGTVTLLYDGGSPTYATLNGTLLTNGPYQSRISRLNNGVRTRSTSNNQVIDYYRTR